MKVTKENLKEIMPTVKAILNTGSVAVQLEENGFSYRILITKLNKIPHYQDTFYHEGLLVALPFENMATLFYTHVHASYLKEKLPELNLSCSVLLANVINQLLEDN